MAGDPRSAGIIVLAKMLILLGAGVRLGPWASRLRGSRRVLAGRMLTSYGRVLVHTATYCLIVNDDDPLPNALAIAHPPSLEIAVCDLCGEVSTTADVPVRDTPTGRSLFGLERCPSCGLVYTQPRPTPAATAAYYDDAYYAHTLGCRPQSSWDCLRARTRSRLKTAVYRACCEHPDHVRPGSRRLRHLARHSLRVAMGWRAVRRVPVLREGRLLDVGCGTGEWLAWVQQTITGWDVEGVEPNRDAARLATARGLATVYVGDLLSCHLPTDRYDCVTFWHSLEHVQSPRLALAETLRILRPGGWLACEVPNIASLEARVAGMHWYHLALPLHLYHFTPATLTAMVIRAGFAIERVEPARSAAGWVAIVGERSANAPRLLRHAAHMAALTAGQLSPAAIRLFARKSVT